VSIHSLSVHSLHFLGEEVDFQGRKVKNIVLDSETFALGPQKLLQSDEVVVTRLDRTLTSGAILTADKTGMGVVRGGSVLAGQLCKSCVWAWPMSYAHVTALLAEAVKELRARQESEVAVLKAEVSQLRALVQELLLLQGGQRKAV
jgi:hypothetical protein